MDNYIIRLKDGLEKISILLATSLPFLTEVNNEMYEMVLAFSIKKYHIVSISAVARKKDSENVDVFTYDKLFTQEEYDAIKNTRCDLTCREEYFELRSQYLECYEQYYSNSNGQNEELENKLRAIFNKIVPAGGIKMMYSLAGKSVFSTAS